MGINTALNENKKLTKRRVKNFILGKRAKRNFKVIGYSEIDKFAIEFYENNHPGIKNFGDITKINPNKIATMFD